MAFHPHRFGRYVIVDPIAVGGMAEIYRARLSAGSKDVPGEAPDRIIIIKKVIANLSQNSEFLQMFEAEIKITVGLTHPNIVQIYDYGRVSDQSFLAMEYVEGKNLRQFVTRLTEAKSMFSIDMSCHIISQICQALSYAYNYKDRFTGKPLHIVHRDISPQNIMISYEGAVKLFDFGIAKAKSAGEATRAGVIKGKPSYLSPEQISGEELDGRSDLFALGVVLWELLTAKRLFVAENDMAILRLIQSAKIEPPSTFNPSIPQGLDAIVVKSLARDRNKRYTNAEEFQRDLHRFLYTFNPAFNPSDLSYYAKELFDKEIKDDRERLMRYLSMDPVGEAELAQEEARAASGVPSKKRKDSGHRPIEGILSSEEFNRMAMEEALKTHGGGNTAIREAALDVQGGAGGTKREISKTTWANRGNIPNLPGKKPGSDVIPPWVKDQGIGGATQINNYLNKKGSRTKTQLLELELHKKEGGTNFVSLFAAVAALAAGFVIGAHFGVFQGTPFEGIVNSIPGLAYTPDPETLIVARKPGKKVPEEAPGQDVRPVLQAPVAPAAQVLTQTQGATQAIILVKLVNEAIADSLQITVNGIPVRMSGRQFVVPIKAKLNIRFTARDHESSSINIEIAEPKTVAVNVDLKALPVGMVSLATTPEAQVIFYSDFQDPIVVRTPLDHFRLAEGRYRMVIENEALKHRSETSIEVSRDKLVQFPGKILATGNATIDRKVANQ